MESRENALRTIRTKAGELEDFLQGDEGDPTASIADPTNANKELKECINGLQGLIEWCSVEIAEEENEKMADEVFEEEEISTLDDAFRDRGLDKAMY